MTATNTLVDAGANLTETYFRLAQATPGSSVWQRGNLRGCTGSFAHPICNFAIGTDLSDADIHELQRITESHEPFHFYLPPGSSRIEDGLRLKEAGFQPIYTLFHMSAEPLYEVANVRPIEATNHASRLALSRFMVGQFFATQPRLYREGIARSTARAGGLDLYAVGFQDDVIGGVMLCRAANTLGVYNLCVKPAFQNQGWGSAIVSWARNCAGMEGLTLTLQCDERLVAWYKKAGFSQIGEIVAFSRPKAGLFDTM